MRATTWEFKNRAALFGAIFGVSFGFYALDSQNSAAALANWIAVRVHFDADVIARLLFGLAAGLIVIAALVRTWASSYLDATVVYAERVKTEALVADGPYRHVRNPLYFGNLLLAVGMGAMMSRIGFFVAIAAMFVFCYRLILREEADLESTQRGTYEIYKAAVPRLLPALHARVSDAGHRARWTNGFRSEFWCWGFAASVAVFAITLSNVAFFSILGGSIVLLWLSSTLIARRENQKN